MNIKKNEELKNKIMKKTFLIATIVAALHSCKQIQYIPTETTKTQFQTNHIRDSIYLKDSILIHQNGDTTIIEKYQYFYKDKLIRDSVHIHDTTPIPYPVEVIKQVKIPLTNWQKFQFHCGRITLILLLLTAIYFIKKRK